jgi:hypothetical protein
VLLGSTIGSVLLKKLLILVLVLFEYVTTSTDISVNITSDTHLLL